jgi:hypothetical protein
LKILLIPKSYGRRDLTNGCCFYPRDYTKEGSPTGTQKGSRLPHLVESLQKKEVEGAASIHQPSVELDVFFDEANYQTIPQSNVMGTSVHLMYSGVAGPTGKMLWAISFCFLLG